MEAQASARTKGTACGKAVGVETFIRKVSLRCPGCGEGSNGIPDRVYMSREDPRRGFGKGSGRLDGYFRVFVETVGALKEQLFTGERRQPGRVRRRVS